MHPFRYALTRGPLITRAPENDDGFDLDDDQDTDDVDLEEEGDGEEEGEEDGEDNLDDLDDVEAPAPKTRGENRIAAATRTAAEAKAEATALKAEMAALRAERTQPKGETQEDFNARLAQMEPWERTETLRQRDAQYMQTRLNQIEFNSADAADKAAYEGFAARNPIAAKLRDQVEDRLANMRSTGTTAPREVVLRYVIGDRQLANAGRATTKTKKSAEARRATQNSRPTSGRSDTAPEDTRRSGSTAARDRRLENREI